MYHVRDKLNHVRELRWENDNNQAFIEYLWWRAKKEVTFVSLASAVQSCLIVAVNVDKQIDSLTLLTNNHRFLYFMHHWANIPI